MTVSSHPLIDLADELVRIRNGKLKTIVVPFVGAGASRSAGLPLGTELRSLIYDAMTKECQHEPHNIAHMLDLEAEEFFPRKAKGGILKLSLFEFASIISRFAWGRKVLHKVIRDVLSKAERIPLVYELLAHFAKHRYLHHAVSVNFDELLDDALKDEVADRLQIIASTDDVPGSRATKANTDTFWLVKPFGSLFTDNFRLDPGELKEFGPKSIGTFLFDTVLSHCHGDNTPDVLLLLIGYAGAEPAFQVLLKTLRHDKTRKIKLYVIDPRDELSPLLEQYNATHIRLDADIAMSVLAEQIRLLQANKDPDRVWTPVARHQIVSRFMSYEQAHNDKLRFKIEILLQAVKSRGFFTVEALTDIPRISHYSRSAYQAISELVHEEKVLSLRQSKRRSRAQAFEDYALVPTDHTALAFSILRILELDDETEVTDWSLTKSNGTFGISEKLVPAVQYLSEQLDKIGSAPEIEIVSNSSRATDWMFRSQRKLLSIEELTNTTADFLRRALDTDGTVIVRGVWVTGEWLFHPDGWASMFGDKLLSRVERGDARLELVLASISPEPVLRHRKHTTIKDKLAAINNSGAVKICEIDWWRLNRRLTLIQAGDGKRSGIYMRRRLFTPLVSPIAVTVTNDCDSLDQMFSRYAEKSK